MIYFIPKIINIYKKDHVFFANEVCGNPLGIEVQPSDFFDGKAWTLIYELCYKHRNNNSTINLKQFTEGSSLSTQAAETFLKMKIAILQSKHKPYIPTKKTTQTKKHNQSNNPFDALSEESNESTSEFMEDLTEMFAKNKVTTTSTKNQKNKR